MCIRDRRKQRVVVEGITTEFVDINRGVSQGTVLGPILFSLMVNDIQLADPRRNLMVKFTDDITISIPVSKQKTDATINEVNSMKHWAASNCRFSRDVTKIETTKLLILLRFNFAMYSSSLKLLIIQIFAPNELLVLR